MKKFSEVIKESKVVKSVKVGDFDHQLHDHGHGYQVRIYNKGQLHHSDMTKNSLEKGLASLDDNVEQTKKQLRIK
jgi:hypothetical protein